MSASWHTLSSLTAHSLTSKRRRLIPSSLSSSSPASAAVSQSLTVAHSSLTGFQVLSTEPTQIEAINLKDARKNQKQNDVVPENQEEEEEEEHGISKIPVTRQKYIPVSKAELLDGIVSTVFQDRNGDEDDAQQYFLLLSS